jgi:hypothetical protein
VAIAASHSNALEIKVVTQCKNRKRIGWEIAIALDPVDH